MRTRRHQRKSARAEQLADLLRLAGLALDANGTAWIRIGVDHLRARTRGVLGAVCLVVGIALRLLPFLLGAGPADSVAPDPGLVATAPASAPAAPGWAAPDRSGSRGHRYPIPSVSRVAREALPVEIVESPGRGNGKDGIA